MIQVNISEVKNRLSYYLKLVKGGEQVEILDRKTPLARIIHVSKANENAAASSAWIQEARELGLVTPPMKGPLNADWLEEDPMIENRQKKTGVLQVLIDERQVGR